MKTNTALARKIARAASAGSKPAMRGDVGNRPAVARRGDTTRLAILNAAERCFGEAGFDGVSLRTITEVAGVDLALVNYHFGSKDNLLREVIARRARVVHDDRVRALEAARHDAGVRSPSIEAIVTAFLEPLLRRLNGGDRGWRYYGGLVSQLDVLPQFIGLTGSARSDGAAFHQCACAWRFRGRLRDRSIGVTCFCSAPWSRSCRRLGASKGFPAGFADRTMSKARYAS